MKAAMSSAFLLTTSTNGKPLPSSEANTGSKLPMVTYTAQSFFILSSSSGEMHFSPANSFPHFPLSLSQQKSTRLPACRFQDETMPWKMFPQP